MLSIYLLRRAHHGRVSMKNIFPIPTDKEELKRWGEEMDKIAQIIMAPGSLAGDIIRAYQTYPAKRNNPSSHGD